jgi:putative membrane protein
MAENGIRSQMKIGPAVYLFFLLGVALFTFLLIQQGVRDVFQAIAAVGWWLVLVLVCHLVPMLLDGGTWWAYFPRDQSPRFRSIFWMRWVGESVSNLLPGTQAGGDIVRARLAVLKGASVHYSTATVLVDITISIFTQACFSLVGAILFVMVTGRTNLVVPLLLAAPVAVAVIVGFYSVQRFGLFHLIGRIVAKCAKDSKWQSLTGRAGELDQALRDVYKRKHVLAACSVATMASWTVGAVEVWIALKAVGIPAAFDKALILESLDQGVKSALFFIPAALGVHEGGYVLIGQMLGIPGHIALALALVRRVRELVFGVPGLFVWQFVEGDRLLRRTQETINTRPARADQ